MTDEARAAAEDTGWGTTFHRHFGSNAIHRDANPEDCDQPGNPRPVYVFDPDYLSEHDEAVHASGVVEGIRQAREAVESCPSWYPSMYGAPDEMYGSIAIRRAIDDLTRD